MAGFNCNPREFQKILKNNGFRYDHQTGDHRIYYRGSEHISVTCSKINPLVAQRLIREHSLKVR